MRLKARPGLARKRKAWVLDLHVDLFPEFDRIRKLGVKFNETALRYLEIDILRNGDTNAYSKKMLDSRTETPLHMKSEFRWVQSFERSEKEL